VGNPKDIIARSTLRMVGSDWTVKEKRAIQILCDADDRGDSLWFDLDDELFVSVEGTFDLKEIQAIALLAKALKKKECWRA